MNIALFGPQGSGKGTQAQLLVDRFNFIRFDAGGYLRQLAKTDPRIDEIVNKVGHLMPDDEMFSLVTKHLSEVDPKLNHLIFDGYPRSVKQYTLLKNWLAKKGHKVDAALFLDINQKETIRRLSARRTCSICGRIYNLITNPPPHKNTCICGGELVQRHDDIPKVIRERLKHYKAQTEPLRHVFNQEQLLIEIDGEQSIEEVHEEIVKTLGLKK